MHLVKFTFIYEGENFPDYFSEHAGKEFAPTERIFVGILSF